MRFVTRVCAIPSGLWYGFWDRITIPFIKNRAKQEHAATGDIPMTAWGKQEKANEPF